MLLRTAYSGGRRLGMKKIVHWVNKYFEEILLVAAMLVMIAVIFWQVVSRYALNLSLAWSEEIARYTFIWTVWLAVPYTVTKGRHIRLTLLRDALGNTGKFILDMLFFVVSALFFLYVGEQSVSLVSGIFTMGQVTPAVSIPKWLCYLALPVGCLLGGLRFIQYGVLRVMRFMKDPGDNETFAAAEMTEDAEKTGRAEKSEEREE